MRKIAGLAFALFILSPSFAYAGLTHLEKLKSRYPYGLIGDDYGLLNELEITPFSGDKNMAYPYWQCFPLKSAKMECDSLGYDSTVKMRTGHLVIDAQNENGLQSYVARDARDMRECRRYLRWWKQKTQGGQYVCVSGSYGGFDGVKEGHKETNWVLDKFKTRKGCVSSGGECSSKEVSMDSCLLPDDWLPGMHSPEVRDGPAYKGNPQVFGKASAQDLFRKYPKIETDRKIEVAIARILKDRGDSIRLSASSKSEYFKNGKLKIPIQLRVPPRCERSSCPVIVNVYGDGSCFSGCYEWRSEIFLQAGFIVAEPNIRGSSFPDRQWEDAAKGKQKFEALTDIQACGEFLKRRFKRHGQEPKIGVVGWSYGGLVALTAMTRFAGTLDAGYALAAKTDLYSFFENAPASLRKSREREYGDPDRDPQIFKDLSPLTYADRVGGPIALMLGGQDPKVSLSDADVFVSKLREQKKDVSLMIVPEHGHLTEKPEEIMFEHARILQFFSEKLRHPLALQ